MAKKTKKEHYVPQCYLEAWQIPNTHQIHVYDKTTDSFRINNIEDVASEHYFYDVKPSDIFSESFLKGLEARGLSWGNEEALQVIEHAFAEEIEKPLSDLLKSIIKKAMTATPWYLKNCYFLSTEQKYDFCGYLTLQLLRTKRIRNGIIGTAECVTQLLEDMGAPAESLKEYSVSKESAKNIHISMLLDADGLSQICNCFWRLTWMLGINRTDKKFLTTDNPIGTWGHIKDPILSMNGIGSRGIEVFYPLSPDIILIMVDGTYHTQWKPFDRDYIEITDSANIDYYNSILAMEAERFVFSSESNMSIIQDMKRQTPDVFLQPHVQMKWGEKTFYPRESR